MLFIKFIDLKLNTFPPLYLYERSDDRRSQRNGYYERELTTRIGSL
ncbi:MAG: transposase, partial [Carnobacterium inhibens]